MATPNTLKVPDPILVATAETSACEKELQSELKQSTQPSSVVVKKLEFDD